jgi:hypothetical protein
LTALIFNVAPTIFEIGLVCAILTVRGREEGEKRRRERDREGIEH